VVVVASAPAKIILFGEHFVVYGEPAVVTAIDKRAHVSAELRKDRHIYVKSVDLGVSGFFTDEGFEAERGGSDACAKLEPIRIAVQKVLDISKKKNGVNVEVHSSIPVASGLGSSAAVVAATAFAVGHVLDAKISQEETFRVAYEAERFVHSTPSGIDPAISTYGGVVLFQKDKGFSPIKVGKDMPLVVGDAGIERSTGEMVTGVRERRERYAAIINSIVEAGGKIALRAVEALEKGDLETLGELMNINHSLLSAVGVSNEALERLVYAARKAGALGAKITGAGGGGCIVALSSPDRLKQVAEAIEHAGGKAFIARKSDEGVKVEG
jgi:mevalonate kinase